jgi:hypothetical protein
VQSHLDRLFREFNLHKRPQAVLLLLAQKSSPPKGIDSV